MKQRHLFAGACMIAAVVLSMRSLPAEAHGPDGHKNLKVLKDDHKALEQGMKAMTKGLGVKCTACHVKGKWDKDDVATKEAGRKFMTAVVGESDREKRSAALASLLEALKIEKAKDEAKIWEGVDLWKKRPADSVDHTGHEGH